MPKKNLILITLDAVRPDHLSCYGYQRIETKNIDLIAKEGVLFENCICSSCLTPVSHASILTGQNPPKHLVRDPFCQLSSKTITEILKENGYKTAGFTGISLLNSEHGFSRGFDYFDEPTEETAWHKHHYKKDDESLDSTWGNWWVDRMLDWIKQNSSDKFFVWGHYFEAHFLSEKNLLAAKKIDPDKLTEYAYYDAKIKYLDEDLFGPLIKLLKDLNLWEDTIIVVTSDHGETLGPENPTWRTVYQDYPQHKTMYDGDLKIPLIIKDSSLKPARRLKNYVRSIDIAPTLLEIMEIKSNEEFDGQSLMPFINGKELGDLAAYAEELYEVRGAGSLQAVRSKDYKLIRNNTKKEEEFYNLKKDPQEKENIIDKATDQEKKIIAQFKEIMDKALETRSEKKVLSKEKEEEVKKKLKELGYIT